MDLAPDCRWKLSAAHASVLCREAGGSELFWGVFHRNEPAFDFYRSLGARDVSDVRLMCLPVR